MLPFLHFVQLEKGNPRRDTGSSYAMRENLPIQEMLYNTFVRGGIVGTIFQTSLKDGDT
jgi:hypothetical protein